MFNLFGDKYKTVSDCLDSKEGKEIFREYKESIIRAPLKIMV